MFRPFTFGLLALLLLSGSLKQINGTPESVDGYWEGTVGQGSGSDFQINFVAAADGLKGAINIPQAGLFAEPLLNVSCSNSKIHFELMTDLGTVPFDGLLANGTISGSLQMGPKQLPFHLKRSKAPVMPYRQEEVGFKNGDVTLAGTLLVPTTKSVHSAIIFVQGSGAQSRFGPGERFRADAFARRGIAVLVYDKRGVGKSTGDWRNASLNDLAADALSGVQLLSQRGDINPRQIGLHGRSQGAWLVELVAAQSNAAFIITEVGGGVAPWQQETYSVEARMRADGFPADQIREALSYTKLHYEVARGAKSWAEYTSVVQRIRNEKWISYKQPWRSLAQAQFTWQKLMGFDPQPALSKLTCPVLAIFAERDASTPTNESALAMKNAFEASGNTQYQFKVFGEADHALLIYPSGGLPHLPAAYVTSMVGWVKNALATTK